MLQTALVTKSVSCSAELDDDDDGKSGGSDAAMWTSTPNMAPRVRDKKRMAKIETTVARGFFCLFVFGFGD